MENLYENILIFDHEFIATTAFFRDDFFRFGCCCEFLFGVFLRKLCKSTCRVQFDRVVLSRSDDEVVMSTAINGIFLVTFNVSNCELASFGIHSSNSSVNLMLFHCLTFLLFRRFRI